jgi:hypothetical protein
LLVNRQPVRGKQALLVVSDAAPSVKTDRRPISRTKAWDAQPSKHCGEACSAVQQGQRLRRAEQSQAAKRKDRE